MGRWPRRRGADERSVCCAVLWLCWARMDCRRYCLPQISQVKTSQYTAGTAAPHPYHISVVRSKFGVNVELGCVRFGFMFGYCTARCHACMPSHAILGSRAVPRVRCDGSHGVDRRDRRIQITRIKSELPRYAQPCGCDLFRKGVQGTQHFFTRPRASWQKPARPVASNLKIASSLGVAPHGSRQRPRQRPVTCPHLRLAV